MAQLASNPVWQILDGNGDPVAGAKVTFYDTGTTTQQTVYSDEAQTIPHATPVEADANGVLPAVFTGATATKAIITDASDVTLYTVDPIPKSDSGNTGAANVSFAPTGPLPYDNVQDAIEGAVAVSGAGYTALGLGVTGNATLLADLDATTTASGAYRFDATTTGTFPTGVSASDTGVVVIWRETATAGRMWIYPDNAARGFERRLATTWQTWREVITVNQGGTDGDIIHRASGAWTRLAIGSAGRVLAVNDGATAAAYRDGMVWSTPVATTSGSAIDFTGIPSWASFIVIAFSEVSISGTDSIAIQIGDSGGIENSGYVASRATLDNGASVSVGSSTASFPVASNTASNAFSGVAILARISSASNGWSFSCTGKYNTTGVSVSGGIKNTSAALDRIRLTVSGANTFDAGSVNVGYL